LSRGTSNTIKNLTNNLSNLFISNKRVNKAVEVIPAIITTQIITAILQVRATTMVMAMVMATVMRESIKMLTVSAPAVLMQPSEIPLPTYDKGILVQHWITIVPLIKILRVQLLLPLCHDHSTESLGNKNSNKH